MPHRASVASLPTRAPVARQISRPSPGDCARADVRARDRRAARRDRRSGAPRDPWLSTAPISIWNEITPPRSTMPRRNSNELTLRHDIEAQVRARQHFGEQLPPADTAFGERDRIADAIAQPDLAARRQRMIRRHQCDEPLLQAHQRLEVRRETAGGTPAPDRLRSAASVAIARSWSNTFTSNCTSGNFAR